jgi:hypothetical protein
MCSNYKLMIAVGKMELVSLGGDGGKNVVFFFKWQEWFLNVKGLMNWIQKQNNVKLYWECATSYCLITNGNMPLGEEHSVFQLT